MECLHIVLHEFYLYPFLHRIIKSHYNLHYTIITSRMNADMFCMRFLRCVLEQAQATMILPRLPQPKPPSQASWFTSQRSIVKALDISYNYNNVKIYSKKLSKFFLRDNVGRKNLWKIASLKYYESKSSIATSNKRLTLPWRGCESTVTLNVQCSWWEGIKSVRARVNAYTC